MIQEMINFDDVLQENVKNIGQLFRTIHIEC